MIRRLAAVALVSIICGCGEKAEQPPANQQSATEKTMAQSNVGNRSKVESDGVGTFSPDHSELSFVGTWAKDKASCASKPWRFTKDKLIATGGPHCSIYDVKAVPGGYDIAVQCPAKKPDPTDLVKLRFAQSAGAMLVESNTIEPMGLISCGK